MSDYDEACHSKDVIERSGHLPAAIRKRLGLKAGTQLVVAAGKDAVKLKAIAPPALDELDALTREARRQVGRAGMKRSDNKKAIVTVRGR